MPVVEAYQCGVPAIVSNTSALPEVAGESGVLVDPLSPESIAKAMLSLAKDESRRQALAQAGLKRAKEFDWNKAAQSIAEIIRSVHG
jgi:glycosyltransferase involved in cell wall biosynthesis